MSLSASAADNIGMILAILPRMQLGETYDNDFKSVEISAFSSENTILGAAQNNKHERYFERVTLR
jgi:hypothetical protein